MENLSKYSQSNERHTIDSMVRHKRKSWSILHCFVVFLSSINVLRFLFFFVDFFQMFLWILILNLNEVSIGTSFFFKNSIWKKKTFSILKDKTRTRTISVHSNVGSKFDLEVFNIFDRWYSDVCKLMNSIDLRFISIEIRWHCYRPRQKTESFRNFFISRIESQFERGKTRKFYNSSISSSISLKIIRKASYVRSFDVTERDLSLNESKIYQKRWRDSWG